MTEFRFPLQQLLDLRSRTEDAARQRLCQRRQESQEQAFVLEQIRGSHEAAASAALGNDSLPAAALLNRSLHQQRLREALAGQQQVLAQCQEAEAQQREALLEANRDRQVVDRLRERQCAAYRSDCQRRESKELEEAGTALHVRLKTAS